jgi:azurin
VRHTFVIDGQGAKRELPGNATRRVEVPLAAGTYPYFCDVPGHEEIMKGTLTVR